jgi:hypothetical protein
MQWLQDPNETNVDNLSYTRREASRHFRNKRKNIWKLKNEEIETKPKIKSTGDLYNNNNNNDFKICYQPNINMRRVIWLQTATLFWLGGGTIFLS